MRFDDLLALAACWLALSFVTAGLYGWFRHMQRRQQRAQQVGERGGFVSSHNGAVQHD